MKKLKRYIGNLCGFFMRDVKYSLFSCICAFALLFANYFLNNQPLFLSNNLDILFFEQKISEWFANDSISYDSVALINVHNDKVEIQVTDSEALARPKIQITDREKLYRFLSIVQQCKPKYIICDMLFEKGESTIYDSLLFQKIKEMDNIVVARIPGKELADSSLEGKSAYAYYLSTITATNFVDYVYLEDSIPFIPTYVYNHVHPNNKIKKIGPFYFQGSSLCQNSVFINFSTEPLSYIKKKSERELEDNKGGGYKYEFQIFDMGIDFMDAPEDVFSDEFRRELIASKVDGKYVFIGDFKEDLHDTYAGMKRGVEILYGAIDALDTGKHRVSWVNVIFMFIAYSLIILLILKKVASPFFFLNEKWRNGVRGFIIDFIGFSAILFLLEMLEYVIFKEAYGLVIPSLFFALLGKVVKFMK